MAGLLEQASETGRTEPNETFEEFLKSLRRGADVVSE
jgi:hypothetical protein